MEIKNEVLLRSIEAYLRLVSHKNAVGVSMFTGKSVVRQEFSQLLSELTHLL